MKEVHSQTMLRGRCDAMREAVIGRPHITLTSAECWLLHKVRWCVQACIACGMWPAGLSSSSVEMAHEPIEYSTVPTAVTT